MTMARYGYDQAPPNGLMPQHYHQPAPLPAQIAPPNDVDSWATVLVSISQLAEQICNTDFVPKEMRGNAPAITAAILTGREIGIGPMTSLAHIQVIKGKPGQSAQLMRQLVLAAGHYMRYIETTDSRCIVEGKRRGEDQWERVTFTADQAKRARIDLMGYPEDKLVARATSRLCRRKFADCLGGMPYTIEELTEGFIDDDPGEQPPAEQAEAPAPKRTAQRRTRKTAEPKPETKVTQVEDDEPTGPPLPGEDDNEPAEPPPAAQADEPSKAQIDKIWTMLGKAGIKERAPALDYLANIIGHDIASSKDLTKAEASHVIDHLENTEDNGPAEPADDEPPPDEVLL